MLQFGTTFPEVEAMRKLVSKSVVVWVVVLFVLAVFPLRAEEQQQEKTEEYVSLDLKESKLGEVLGMIAKRCGVSFILNTKRDFPVTAALKDVHFEQAMELLANSAGIGFRVIGNTYYFDYCKELEEKFDVGLSNVCRLQFADAVDVKCLLTEVFGEKNRSFSVTSNSRSNSVIISGSPEMIGAAMELIKETDVPVHRLSITSELVQLVEAKATRPTESILARLEGIVTNGSQLSLKTDDNIPTRITEDGKQRSSHPEMVVSLSPQVNDDGWINMDVFSLCKIVEESKEASHLREFRREIRTNLSCREGQTMEIGRFFNVYSGSTFIIRITPKIVR